MTTQLVGATRTIRQTMALRSVLWTQPPKLMLTGQGKKGSAHTHCSLTLWQRQTLLEKGWKAPPHGVFSPFQGYEEKTSLSVG